MASILFTDASGTWRLHNGKAAPGSRFANWNVDSLPKVDSSARQSDGQITAMRFRDDFGVTFELPMIPSIRSSNSQIRAEEISDVAWTKSNATVTADSIAAPDGSLTADKVAGTATAGLEVYGNSGSAVAGAQYAFSAFVKPGDSNYIWFGDRGDAIWRRVWINAVTGQLATLTDVTAARITPYLNGWIRVEVILTRTNASTLSASFGPSDADGLTTITAGKFCYVWGVQVELGAYAKPYLMTTSAARSGISQYEIADRLRYHLINGGSCSVYTNDIVGSSYATCGLKPGTTPTLRLSDKENIEHTLSLHLINLAGSPSRMLCHYAEQ